MDSKFPVEYGYHSRRLLAVNCNMVPESNRGYAYDLSLDSQHDFSSGAKAGHQAVPRINGRRRFIRLKGRSATDEAN